MAKMKDAAMDEMWLKNKFNNIVCNKVVLPELRRDLSLYTDHPLLIDIGLLQRAFSVGFNSVGQPQSIFGSPLRSEDITSTLKKVSFDNCKIKTNIRKP